MNALLMIALLAPLPGLGDLTIVQRFQVPDGEMLNDPHYMDFSPDGQLYVVDRNACRILRWAKGGKYLNAFGTKGQGPGELTRPELIHVTKDEVWVFNRGDSRFCIYDRMGGFKRSFFSPIEAIRRFAVVNPNLVLVVHQVRDEHPYMSFDLIDDKGQKTVNLKKITSSLFLGSNKGDNQGPYKGYGPEADISSDKAGTIWFGFSDESKLYKLDNKGKLVGEKQLVVTMAKPTDEEQADVLDMRLSLPGGGVGTLKEMPGMTFKFDFPKSLYTNFTLRGDQLYAVSTPIAGNDIVKGYNIASYQLIDFASGKSTGMGRYRLPEDSQVIYNNGHALAFLIDEDGEFQVAEVTLPGRKRQ